MQIQNLDKFKVLLKHSTNVVPLQKLDVNDYFDKYKFLVIRVGLPRGNANLDTGSDCEEIISLCSRRSGWVYFKTLNGSGAFSLQGTKIMIGSVPKDAEFAIENIGFSLLGIM